MKIRLYQGLDTDTMPGFGKFRQAIEADDFARAQISKIDDNLYRARLGKSARLLFSFYSHEGETSCLVLEHLPHHDYEKSRFLARGVAIDEQRIEADNTIIKDSGAIEATPAAYLNPQGERFHVLDKVLSFDDEQQAIFEQPAPLVIVGSAGSGKTALTLEKMKQATGDVLYVSLSPYLVQNARDLYHANRYENEDQELDFLSFTELLESIRVPAGHEAVFSEFEAWFARHKAGSGIRDAHTLFEEFRGVLTANVRANMTADAGDTAYLSRDEYLNLGVRQSIFASDQRAAVYTLFERYLAHLKSTTLFDPNIICHQYRELASPCYDFVVVDEVQDFTNVQLFLILGLLRSSGNFLLCGDANQIVHPNFFSWSSLKSLFFENRGLVGRGETLRILKANYRNSPLVTDIANRILKLKHARFGSVDRESNHLVASRGDRTGALQLLQDSNAVRTELDKKTGRSTHFAVLVMHGEDKAEAQRVFSTPLVFSIQEAKGLEYESIILFGFINGEERAFRDIAAGVEAADLEHDELNYARAKDKQDKSLEIYKFYINALYVAITRATKNLYLVEPKLDHPAITLLDLERFTGELSLEQQGSSLEDWQREARKLELQGKREQAEAIHERILERKPVPWPVLDREAFTTLRDRALDLGHKKELLRTFEYALLHQHQSTLNILQAQEFKPTRQPEDKALKLLFRNHFTTYELSSANAVLKDTERYGIDHRTVFNLTPLMLATKAGNVTLVEALLERGANPSLVANHGLSAVQMVLECATTDARYASSASAALYQMLAPSSLSVQVDSRLEKLGGHLMGLFLLNLMFAQFYRHLNESACVGKLFNAKELTKWVTRLPDALLPAKRKRQAYISGVLSGNEVNRDAPYNRKLFKRLSRGQYIINPNLKLRIGDEWVGVHDLLQLDDLAVRYELPEDSRPIYSEQQRELRERVREDILWGRERGLDRFREAVRTLIETQPQPGTPMSTKASLAQVPATAAVPDA